MSKPSTKENILQVIDGFNFRLYPTEKYFKGWCVIDGKKTKTTAHRYVWQKHNGKIEKGIQIHHKDEDKSNNSIGNLEKLTAKQHSRKHLTEERKEQSRKILDEKARPKAKEWHGSEEGRKWHAEHAKNSLFGEIRNLICPNCEKNFETKFKITKYCSYDCKVKFNNRRKITDGKSV